MADVTITIGAHTEEATAAFKKLAAETNSTFKNIKNSGGAFDALNKTFDKFGSLSGIATAGIKRLNSALSGIIFGGLIGAGIAGFNYLSDAIIGIFKNSDASAEGMEKLTDRLNKQASAWKILPEPIGKVSEEMVVLHNATLDYLQLLGKDKGDGLERKIKNMTDILGKISRNESFSFVEMLSNPKLAYAKRNIDAFNIEVARMKKELAEAKIELKEWNELQTRQHTTKEKVEQSLGSEAIEASKKKLHDLDMGRVKESLSMWKGYYKDITDAAKTSASERAKLIEDLVKLEKDKFEANKDINKTLFELQTKDATEEERAYLLEVQHQQHLNTIASSTGQTKIDAIKAEIDWIKNSKDASYDVWNKMYDIGRLQVEMNSTYDIMEGKIREKIQSTKDWEAELEKIQKQIQDLIKNLDMKITMDTDEAYKKVQDLVNSIPKTVYIQTITGVATSGTTTTSDTSHPISTLDDYMGFTSNTGTGGTISNNIYINGKEVGRAVTKEQQSGVYQ